MELFRLFGSVFIKDEASEPLERIKDKSDSTASGFKGSASKIGKAVATAFSVKKMVDFEKQVVSTYSGYDDQMRKVQAVTGATGEEFQQLRAKAEELGAKTRFSATEAGQGMEALSRSGWNTQQVMSGIGPVLNFATANSIELGQASEIVANGLRQFGLEAEDASEFTDVLSATASNSSTDIQKLGDTFQYVGPVAGALGYKLQDVSVAIGLMANKGIAGSQAGTTLRSALSSLANPSKKASEELNSLGISLTDSSGEIKPFNQLIAEMREKFSTLSDAQKAQKISTIFGQQAMSGMLAVVNASDEEFNNMTKAIENADGTTQKMADTMDAGLGGALAGVKSAWENLLIQLGKMQEGFIVDAVNLVADALRKLPEIIGKINSVLGKFTNFVKENKTAMTALAIAITTMGTGFAIYNSGIGKMSLTTIKLASSLLLAGGKMKLVKSITQGFGTAMSFLQSPIGIATLAVTAFATVAYLIISNWETIGPWLTELWEGIKEVATSVWEGIKNVITGVVLGIKFVVETGFTLLVTLVRIPFEIIKAIVMTVWNFIGEYIMFRIEFVKTIVTIGWNVIKTVTMTVFNGLKAIVTTVWEGIKTVISTVVNAIVVVVSPAWNKIKSVTTTVFNAIKGVASSVWNSIKSVISSIVESIKSKVTGVWNSIKSTTSSVWNGIKNAMVQPVESAKNKIQSTINRIKGFFSNLRLRFPKIQMPPLPHFTMSGSFSLNPPSVPKLGVQWYSKGGIFPNKTILGGVGVGDLNRGHGNNAEAVLPLDLLWKQMDEKFAKYATVQPEQQPEQLVINIEHFENNREGDVRAFAEELEFYKNQINKSKGVK